MQCGTPGYWAGLKMGCHGAGGHCSNSTSHGPLSLHGVGARDKESDLEGASMTVQRQHQ